MSLTFDFTITETGQVLFALQIVWNFKIGWETFEIYGWFQSVIYKFVRANEPLKKTHTVNQFLASVLKT